MALQLQRTLNLTDRNILTLKLAYKCALVIFNLAVGSILIIYYKWPYFFHILSEYFHSTLYSQVLQTFILLSIAFILIHCIRFIKNESNHQLIEYPLLILLNA